MAASKKHLDMETYQRIILEDREIRFTASQFDKLLASQYNIVTAILKTQEIQNDLITAITMSGISLPREISDKITTANNVTKSIVDDITEILNHFVAKAGADE